ncbi:hypothetical protein FACS189419_04900 [Planctomycetales bacterium]|nr:hypothetical protein FACS189419_04900 [Planctomycetales bacterium]
MATNNSLAKMPQRTSLTAPVGENVRKVLSENQQTLENACKIWGLNPQNMIRAAASLIESVDFSGNEKSALKLCTGQSVLNAITECARLGLDPSFGRAYLIPYKFRRNDPDNASRRAQLQISYIGMIDLALRNKDIKRVGAEVVLDGDEFSVELGVAPSIKHYPQYQSDDITFAYAYAVFADGEVKLTVMPKSEIDRIRSKSQNSKAWADFYGEMAKKSAIKRLFKTLPKLSTEVHEAVAIDNSIEFATSEHNASNDAVDLPSANRPKLSGPDPVRTPQEPESEEEYTECDMPDDEFFVQGK